MEIKDFLMAAPLLEGFKPYFTLNGFYPSLFGRLLEAIGYVLIVGFPGAFVGNNTAFYPYTLTFGKRECFGKRGLGKGAQKDPQ
jgi:hypothetical protein